MVHSQRVTDDIKDESWGTPFQFDCLGLLILIYCILVDCLGTEKNHLKGTKHTFDCLGLLICIYYVLVEYFTTEKSRLLMYP